MNDSMFISMQDIGNNPESMGMAMIDEITSVKVEEFIDDSWFVKVSTRDDFIRSPMLTLEKARQIYLVVQDKISGWKLDSRGEIFPGTMDALDKVGIR